MIARRARSEKQSNYLPVRRDEERNSLFSGGSWQARRRGQIYSVADGNLAAIKPIAENSGAAKSPLAIPGYALHGKKVYGDKLATVHWSAARNEERPTSRG